MKKNKIISWMVSLLMLAFLASCADDSPVSSLEEEIAGLNEELEGLLAQVPAECKAQADDFKSKQDDYVELKEVM